MKFRNSSSRVLQAVLLLPSESRSAIELRSGFQFAFVRLLVGLLVSWAVVFGPSVLAMNPPAQQKPGSTVAFVTSIQWNRQPGVTKYRLQIAGDENFTNVFYDGRVAGERHTISNLLPGQYYWRVAPADSQTGEFSRPVRFFVSGGVITSAPLARRAGTAARLIAPVSSDDQK
ncbi:MAG: hypothetical protein M3R69_05290 [Acidobacteriota bacterium]|nr:hypothetical protein [Acidobacteriota bacterium]